MKNSFRQHIPNFAQPADPAPTYEFDTTEELLALKIVQRYADCPKFSHFAMSKNHLMQISDEGFRWWVIGYIKDPTSINLPQWDGGKYRARLQNGEEVVLSGKEVYSSCGDVLTLKDGTTAKDLTR